MLQVIEAVDAERIRDLERLMVDTTVNPVCHKYAEFWIRIYRKEFYRAELDQFMSEWHLLVTDRVKILYAMWQHLSDLGRVHSEFPRWVKLQVVGPVIPGDFMAVPIAEGRFRPVMPCHIALEEVFHTNEYQFTLRRTDDHALMRVAEMH